MMDANSSITEFEVINKILDTKVIGFPIWQTLLIIGSVITIILLLMCCCISFRIPRTKQEIEADYIRKQITRKFRKQLDSIPDSEMDEMDLSKAIEKVRFEFMSDAEKAAEILKISVEKLTDSPSKIPVEPKSETCDKTSVNSNAMKTGTSEEKLMERGNSVLNNKLVTIVNAFTVLRPKKMAGDGKSKQMTV